MSIKNKIDATLVLKKFAEHGYSKTAMDDISNIMGISRQAVHKRYGSKEGCYNAAIEYYLNAMYLELFELLDKGKGLETLTKVFDVFLGNAVEIVSQKHGAEIFADVLKFTHSAKEDWPFRFKLRLAIFLEDNGYSNKDDSLGLAFSLISAGKGLLLERKTRDNFMEDMQIIITTLIKNKDNG
tara:strand:- start:322 stop:870 length:549 start_codon:yes stop_codon:yes gene_type:complete